MIRLDPMGQEELHRFLNWLIRDYADAHVRAGQWDPATALEQSRVEIEKLLPKGIETPDHFVRSAFDAATSSKVGEAWYNLRQDGRLTILWIYWIGVEAQFRRRGYGEMILRELEGEAKRLGASRIALHVFGDNTGARALYSKMGYSETNVVMSKPVPA